ncbi:MAG: hypothetical protein GXP36_00145 [Actinobacteria bacterium]|nr:hypothetical protein [Actinomycetota bacterium]
MMRTQRNLVLAALLFALVLAVGACTNSGSEDNIDTTITTTTTGATTTTVTVGAGSKLAKDRVQDLWAIDTLTTIDESAATVDLTGAVLAAVRDELGASIDLWDGVTFRAAPSLAASLIDAAGETRADVEVVAGIATTSAGDVLIIIATPRSGAMPVASTDRLQLDLTFLEGQVSVGDPVFADYVFIQSFGPAGTVDDPPDDGVAMFAARVANGRFSVLAESNEAGELTPAVARGQLGEFVEGSLLGNIPPKILLWGGVGLAAGVTICIASKGAACAAIPLLGGGGAAAGAAATLSGNGADPAPPPPARDGGGRSTGEPHLVTFDGIAYDSQLVGEFVLARTDDVEIQTRQSPYGTSRLLAYNTAVAVGVAGHRVTYDVESDQPLRIDGDFISLKPGASVNHDSTQVTAYDGVIEIVTNEGDIVQIQIGPGVNIIVVPAGAGRTWAGLLGNPNGNPSDDLTTRSGGALEESAESGYAVAESWRITDGESLFDYAAGENTATYTDLDYPDARTTLADLDANTRTRAAAVCRTAGVTAPLMDECVFDYGITGDVAWAAAAQRLAASLDGAYGDTQLGRTLLAPLPDYRVDRASRAVLDAIDRLVFPAQEAAGEGAVLVALDPLTGDVTEWPNIDYVCGPGVDSQGRIWVQRPSGGGHSGPQSMVVIDGVTEKEIAIYAPTESDKEILGCQRSIVSIGDNVILLHRPRFEATVESLGFDGDAVVSRWRRGFPDANLADLTVGPAGEVYVLTRNQNGDAAEIVLSRVDSDSGEIVAELTLAGERFEEGNSSVVIDSDGRVYVVTTEVADLRAGYVFGVSAEDNTLRIDWQIEISGTATEGVRQTPRSLNIVGDNIVGWYMSLAEVVAIDRATGELAWEFDPPGVSAGIDEIPGDSSGNAYLTRGDAYLVVVDGEGVEVRSVSTGAAGVPPIAAFGPISDGRLFALSLGVDDVPIWAIIDVTP